jgi:hypothetical protein
MFREDDLVGQDHGVFNGVFKLPDVAGPGVGAENVARLFAKTEARFVNSAGGLF